MDRAAISAFVHDALAPSAMQAVVHEGIAQLRDGISVLPDVIQPYASRWLDKFQAVADMSAVASEISLRVLRLVEPMLSRANREVIPELSQEDGS